MGQTGVEKVWEGMGHRRYPHLSRQDVGLLDALRASCGEAAARSFERLLRAQHRDERHAKRHVLTDRIERRVSARRRRRA